MKTLLLILKGLPVLTVCVAAPAATIMPKEASNPPNAVEAFEGPFFYLGDTTVKYQYYSEDSNDETYQTTLGKKNIDSSRTITVTEQQELTYYLHKPIHYDPNKSYPIIAFTSGDGISVFSDNEIKGDTTVDFSSFAVDSEYYPLSNKYRQNIAYGDSYINPWGVSINSQGYYLTSYYEYQGSKKQALKLPHYNINAGNKDDTFVTNWYDMVYNQGKEEYDCFFLFIQPTDRMWFENKSNKKMLTIQNEMQDASIYNKYSSDTLAHASANTSAHIATTYIASELSPAPESQLLCNLIDDLCEQYTINPARQYLAGYSLGAQFSYDTVCHYPDRFACCMTAGLPTVDLTTENCKNWVNTSFWGFNGTGDICDRNAEYASKFVEKVRNCRDDSSIGSCNYSVCNGGHLGIYLTGTVAAVSGTNIDITSKMSTYTFMFSSERTDYNFRKAAMNQEIVDGLTINALASSSLKDGTYDLALISNEPLCEYEEKGFVLTTGETLSESHKQTKEIPVKGFAKTTDIYLGDIKTTISALDYGAAYVYVYVIKAIPQSVTHFDFKSYCKTKSGTLYSEKRELNISFIDNQVKLEVL